MVATVKCVYVFDRICVLRTKRERETERETERERENERERKVIERNRVDRRRGRVKSTGESFLPPMEQSLQGFVVLSFCRLEIENVSIPSTSTEIKSGGGIISFRKIHFNISSGTF